MTRRPGRSRTLLLIPAVVTAGLAFIGCRSLPPTHYYVLAIPEAAAPASSAPAAVDLRLEIQPLGVEPPYDQQQIAYRPPSARHEVAFYHYHRWAAAPGRLLTRALANALDRRASVSTAPAATRGAPDFVVSGTVRRLEEVDRADGIVVRLDLDLRYTGARNGQLRLRLERPAHAATLEAVVEAFAEAMDQAASDLIAELGRD